MGKKQEDGGGGCTGNLQPLDTDFHDILSKLYQEEMECLTRVAEQIESRYPVLDRTTLMSILVFMWQRSQVPACRWFRDNSFTGSEECKKDWSECDMNEMRQQISADFEDAYKKGELPLKFESYQSLLTPFAKKGSMEVIEAGYEDEGSAVQDGEVDWDENEGCLSPPFASDAEDEQETGDAEDSVVAEICADPVICRQVQLHLNRYDRMAEDARAGNDNELLVAIDNLILDATEKAREEKKSLVEARARAAEEQERLCEERADARARFRDLMQTWLVRELMHAKTVGWQCAPTARQTPAREAEPAPKRARTGEQQEEETASSAARHTPAEERRETLGRHAHDIARSSAERQEEREEVREGDPSEAFVPLPH